MNLFMNMNYSNGNDDETPQAQMQWEVLLRANGHVDRKIQRGWWTDGCQSHFKVWILIWHFNQILHDWKLSRFFEYATVTTDAWSGYAVVLATGVPDQYAVVFSEIMFVGEENDPDRKAFSEFFMWVQ